MLKSVRTKIDDVVTDEFRQKFSNWWNGTEFESDAAGAGDAAGDEGAGKPPALNLAEAIVEQRHIYQVSEGIFGSGYLNPGGDEHMEEWGQQLSLTKEKSAGFIGASLGGAARDIARSSGCWFTVYQPESELVAMATERMSVAGMSKKVEIVGYAPGELEIPEEKYNAVASKEAFWKIEDKEQVLAQIKAGVKPNGLIMFTDYILSEEAVKAANADDQAKWFEHDSGAPHLWTEASYVAKLEELELELRIHEDVTGKFVEQTIEAWATGYEKYVQLVQTGDESDAEKASLLKAVASVAEMWTYRTQGLAQGDLKVMRFLLRRGGKVA